MAAVVKEMPQSARKLITDGHILAKDVCRVGGEASSRDQNDTVSSQVPEEALSVVFR
jgi:hypothetical protein